MRLLAANRFVKESAPLEYLSTGLSKNMTERTSTGVVDSLQLTPARKERLQYSFVDQVTPSLRSCHPSKRFLNTSKPPAIATQITLCSLSYSTPTKQGCTVSHGLAKPQRFWLYSTVLWKASELTDRTAGRLVPGSRADIESSRSVR